MPVPCWWMGGYLSSPDILISNHVLRIFVGSLFGSCRSMSISIGMQYAKSLDGSFARHAQCLDPRWALHSILLHEQKLPVLAFGGLWPSSHPKTHSHALAAGVWLRVQRSCVQRQTIKNRSPFLELCSEPRPPGCSLKQIAVKRRSWCYPCPLSSK